MRRKILNYNATAGSSMLVRAALTLRIASTGMLSNLYEKATATALTSSKEQNL